MLKCNHIILFLNTNHKNIITFFFQIRKNNLRLHVRRRHALLNPIPRALYLLYMPANQPKANEERHEIPRAHLRRTRNPTHAGHTLQHGGGRPARARQLPGHPHRQLVSVTGKR